MTSRSIALMFIIKLWIIIKCKFWLLVVTNPQFMYLCYCQCQHVRMQFHNIGPILGLQNQLAIDSIEKTGFKTSKKWVESYDAECEVAFIKHLCWDHTKGRSVPTLQHYSTVLMPHEENSLIKWCNNTIIWRFYQTITLNITMSRLSMFIGRLDYKLIRYIINT